jgi:hypothetical protein
MSSKYKSKKISSSESDSELIFTKIKKIYKCGICDKKIKNYCKCISSQSPHSGSNIITIMTNPDQENNQKNIPMTKCEKGEKGERGLTGSMGLPGNSFIFFTTNNQIKSGDFIGMGYSDTAFLKSAISVPYDFYIKQIGFTVKTQIKTKYTIILYVNDKPTDYVICLCEGQTSNKIFNSIVKIKSSDLFCFKLQSDSNDLSNSVCISLVIN